MNDETRQSLAKALSLLLEAERTLSTDHIIYQREVQVLQPEREKVEATRKSIALALTEKEVTP